MEAFALAFIGGLSQATESGALLMMLLGTAVGLGFGIIPGLQSVTALSVFLPITYYWSPVYSMYFFAGIIGSAGNGGAITAILLNIPGTAQNSATLLDGYPMAQQGRAVFALNLSASASWLGSLFGVLVLVAFVPVFLPFVLSFGPAEIFWIGVFGLVSMTVAISSSIAKGLASVGIGVFLSIIGLGGPRLPVARFTFGSDYLLDGLNLVVVVIGFLVISECFAQMAQIWGGKGAQITADEIPAAPSADDWRQQMADGLLAPFRHFALFMRSSALGTLIGAIPGVGGSVAQFLSYNAAVASSKNPETFGTGRIEGLVATEAATNAKEGGALLPTLLLGIPGNAEMALVLAAWQIHGLEPGPLFLNEHADLAWALVFGLVISNFVSSALTIAASPKLSRLPHFDMGLVLPAVLVASLIAAFAIRANFLDVAALIFIGLFGWLMRAFGYSVIGVVIGFVIGGVIEKNYYTALQSSLGGYSVFIASGTAIVLAAATTLTLLISIYRVAKMPRTNIVITRGTLSLSRFIRRESIWFTVTMLAGICGLLWLATRDTFRGGPVAPGVLLLIAAMLTIGLVQSYRNGGTELAHRFTPVGLLMLFNLVAIYFAGFYAGLFVVVSVWLYVYGTPPRRMLILAMVYAVLVPFAFSALLGTPIWRGVIPEIIPGIIGGEIPPSL